MTRDKQSTGPSADQHGQSLSDARTGLPGKKPRTSALASAPAQLRADTTQHVPRSAARATAEDTSLAFRPDLYGASQSKPMVKEPAPRVIQRTARSNGAQPIQRSVIMELDDGDVMYDAVRRVISAAQKEPGLKELTDLASDPTYKLALIFTSLPADKLGKLEKGGERAAAITGMYFLDETLAEKIERLSAMNPPAAPEKAVDDKLKGKSIERLRENNIQIKIVVNATAATNKSKGEAIQIISHEFAIHALKFANIIKKIRSTSFGNDRIESELKSGYQERSPDTHLLDPRSTFGDLHPLKQHARFVRGDQDYVALKEHLTLSEEERDDFGGREIEDLQNCMQTVKMAEKLYNRQ